MARIDEHKIFARYIGEKVNALKLDPIAHSNGNGCGSYSDSEEYIVSHVDYYEDDTYQKVFGLTPTLIEKWDCRGIDFSVYLYVRDGIITGGHVFKYIETSTTSHYRTAGFETDATQQELRVVARILTYITSEV